jgi:Fe-S cluster biogenesis protein NfuA
MEKEEKKQFVTKIKSALDKIRPYLVADGGDVSFVSLNTKMQVKVHLSGACGHCPFSLFTLKAGVEQTLLQEIPQISKVIAV